MISVSLVTNAMDATTDNRSASGEWQRLIHLHYERGNSKSTQMIPTAAKVMTDGLPVEQFEGVIRNLFLLSLFSPLSFRLVIDDRCRCVEKDPVGMNL
jgi:hypothetical protein